MKELPEMSTLLIEPNQGMRSSLHAMLNMCGILKIDHAISSSNAIRTLLTKNYDVILCEYDLAEGQDGQQLLEDLRHNKIIPLWTIFILVTAERTYTKVVSAAELAPNDYLLKPFAADALLERLQRVLEKRAIFMPAHLLIEQGSLPEAIKMCMEKEQAHPRYAIDFKRLRAEQHLALGQFTEAETIYGELLTVKGFPWARLGQAKALFMQKRYQETEQLLMALIADHNTFMDAYDWLAKVKEAIDQPLEAKEVLQNAVAISPHAVQRLRKLGQVALATGDIETAEKSLQKAISKAKYSEFRDPEDHVRLVKTLVQKGDTQAAALIVRDMEKSLRDQPKTAACKAISAALIHETNGNAERAAEELTAAIAACRDTAGLSSEIKIGLAKTCLEKNMEEGATEIILDVMNNSTDGTMAQAVSVLEQAGRKDLVESLVKESRRQVIEMVSSGAEKAKKGDYQGAVQLMTEAAHKLPNNPQVIFNAALAALKYLENLGWDAKLGGEARWYIENTRRLDPANPRLTPLSELYRTVLKKYGILPNQVTAKPPLP